MILSKQEFISSLTNYLPDNANQEISPLDLRTVITNLADSIHLMTASTSIDAVIMRTKSKEASVCITFTNAPAFFNSLTIKADL